jgi:hypothetical protein
MPVPKVVSQSEPISAVGTITNPVGTKNVAGTQVNPATEDTLAKLMPTTGTKYAVALTNADTEYSQALPANTKKFRIHLRDYATFRLAYVTGKVATPTDPYETIPAGSEKYEDELLAASLTVYLASPVAGKTAEVEAWS